MIGRFRLSHLVLKRLGELSVPVEEIFRRAGLPASLRHEPKILLDTGQLFAFWSAVAEVGGDPAIGLRLGTLDRVEHYDPTAIAALSAASFRDAVDRAARYKQLTCPEEIRVVTRGDECAIGFHWTEAARDEPPVLVDLCFAWVLGLGRRGTGERLAPRRVELRSPSSHADAYRELLGCRPRFGCEANLLVLARADFDRPFVTQNAEMLAAIAPQLERELAERDEPGRPRERVKLAVKRLLAGRRPEVREVARDLGWSTRTLQRRLGEEGATFQQVLEDARRELARHYLSRSTLELSETAYLLGYEDASSFFRAFRRWEGVAPGRWRTAHRAGREDSGGAAVA